MRYLAILTLVALWLSSSTFALPMLGITSSLQQKNYLSLERRTDEPPNRRLSPEEYRERFHSVSRQIQERMDRDAAFAARFMRALEQNTGSTGDQVVSNDKQMNRALKEAGWNGEYIPELPEDITRALDEFVNEVDEIIKANPHLESRYRAILAREMDQTDNYVRAMTRALRKAGYTGPLSSDPGPSSRGFGGPRGGPPRGPRGGPPPGPRGGPPPGPREGPPPGPGGSNKSQLNEPSLNPNSPRPGFLSNTMQSLRESFLSKTRPVMKAISSVGSPATHPVVPSLPVTGPLGRLGPI